MTIPNNCTEPPAPTRDSTSGRHDVPMPQPRHCASERLVHGKGEECVHGEPGHEPHSEHDTTAGHGHDHADR